MKVVLGCYTFDLGFSRSGLEKMKKSFNQLDPHVYFVPDFNPLEEQTMKRYMGIPSCLKMYLFPRLKVEI